MNEITELQQFWLRNQSELVKTIKDVQRQSGDMEYLKKQYTILLQKKLRIEGTAGTPFPPSLAVFSLCHARSQNMGCFLCGPAFRFTRRTLFW